MKSPWTTAADRGPPPGQGSARGRPSARGVVGRGFRGFTLTELLVAVSIMLVLVSIVAAGISGARGNSKKSVTQALIGRLNVIIQQQYSSYASRGGPTGASAADRGVWLRRLISAELPDSWADVAFVWSNTNLFGSPPSGTLLFPKEQLSGPQRSYISIWNGLSSSQRTAVPAQFGDAECLFMVVMQGGIASCLDCGQIRPAQIGDRDGDGMPEFVDDWGNPIRYVLWPAALEVPPGSGPFFSATPPLAPGASLPAPGGPMRPLIFSGGADQINSIQVNASGNLAMGSACGVPASLTFGARDDTAGDGRADNITNFDDEVKR